MPKIDKHASGTFCWIELATTDQAGAKSFSGYERGRTIAVEIVGADQVLLCPSREFPCDGPLPLQSFIGIAGGAKVLEKRFDLVFEQTL
jgi:hypothetical protein